MEVVFWWISFLSRWNWLDGSRANCKLSKIMTSSEISGKSVKLPSKWNTWLKRLKKLSQRTLNWCSALIDIRNLWKAVNVKKHWGNLAAHKFELQSLVAPRRKNILAIVFCVLPRGSISHWTKKPKKTFGRFMGHSGHYFGQILGLKNLAGAFLSKHLNCWLCTSALKLI